MHHAQTLPVPIIMAAGRRVFPSGVHPHRGDKVKPGVSGGVLNGLKKNTCSAGVQSGEVGKFLCELLRGYTRVRCHVFFPSKVVHAFLAICSLDLNLREGTFLLLTRDSLRYNVPLAPTTRSTARTPPNNMTEPNRTTKQMTASWAIF